LEKALNWSSRNGMQLNADKTTVTQLGKATEPLPQLTVNSQYIRKCDTIKLLGLSIDSKLSFNDHVANTSAKCNSLLFLMRKLKQFGLNSNGLLLFYISSIRTVLCYASPAFYTILSKANFNKLDRIQRQATHHFTSCRVIFRKATNFISL
jgi:hypothetical protein